jgi:hypothetical protein
VLAGKITDEARRLLWQHVQANSELEKALIDQELKKDRGSNAAAQWEFIAQNAQRGTNLERVALEMQRRCSEV